MAFCPYCFTEDKKIKMENRKPEQVIPLLIPMNSSIMAFIGKATLEKGQGQWRECPECGLALMFRQK